jgi:hypothetical protein
LQPILHLISDRDAPWVCPRTVDPAAESTSAPRRWSLAASDDEWGEVFCTANEEPAFWKKAGPRLKQEFERQMKPGVAGQ